MPALTEFHAQRPQARVDWVVEESYAPLVRLHGAVSQVIPVNWRRWRQNLLDKGAWREIASLRAQLRAGHYDAVIDAQGLIKSAIIAAMSARPRYGLDWSSAREPIASLSYAHRVNASWDLHAVERCRRLFSAAGSYALSDQIAGPDYGLLLPGGSKASEYRCVLLHGTAQASKCWPEAHWRTIAVLLNARGMQVILPHGSADELARAERLAEGISGAQVAPRSAIDDMARLLAGSALVIGLDTGLLHLAAALRVPLVAIHVDSSPQATGPRGQGPIEVCGSIDQPPTPADVLAAIDRLNSAIGDPSQRLVR